MEYGFARFEQKQLYQKGEQVDTLVNEKGNPPTMPLVTMEDACYVVEKGKESTVVRKELQITQDAPPYDPDTSCAQLIVTMSDGYRFSVPLSVEKEVQRASYLDLWIRSFRQMLA